MDCGAWILGNWDGDGCQDTDQDRRKSNSGVDTCATRSTEDDTRQGVSSQTLCYI